MYQADNSMLSSRGMHVRAGIIGNVETSVLYWDKALQTITLYICLQITTVDKFQGQQNDFILLSLVRTRFVGHLRDVRRLVVAMSRARLGLYVFCRRSLFEQCYELQPTFQLLLRRPDRLALNLSEISSCTERHVEDTGPIHLVSGVEEMGEIVSQLYQVLFSSLPVMEFSH